MMGEHKTIETVATQTIRLEKIYKNRLLSEQEARQKAKNTPKINIEELLKQGCMETREFHLRLENGEI